MTVFTSNSRTAGIWPTPGNGFELIIRQREEEARKRRAADGGKRLAQRGCWRERRRRPPPCSDEIIQMLTGLALYGGDAPDFKHGKELLKRIGISDAGESRKLLVTLGVWEADENLDLLRAGVVPEFGDAEYAESVRLHHMSWEKEGREDLTGLPVIYHRNGPLTRDFDDAVSLQPEPDGLLLGLHISDVSAAVTPGSPPGPGRRHERASSLYLPRKMIPMLPPDLSHEALSLVEGAERRAVSLLARFDTEGNLRESRFTPSVIRVGRRMSYDQVNEQITDDEVFVELYRLSRLLRRRRIEKGALNISLPDLEVAFSAEGAISFEHIDQNTPSRSIVAELMILYNGAGR